MNPHSTQEQTPVTTFVSVNPEWDAPIQVTEYDRPDGDDERTTGQTIAVMQNEVRAAATHPRVIRATREAIKEANLDHTATFEDVTDALFWWCKNHIHYQHEEEIASLFNLQWDAELEQALAPPADLLGMPRPSGDCADYSMLLAAMCRVLGIGTAFKTVAADPRQPHQYSHVFVVARDPKNRINLKPLDASNGPEPGVEYRPIYKAKLWPLDDMLTPDPQQTLAGLGSLGDDGGDSGFDWDTFSTTIANDITKIATPILQGRFSTPTLAPGTYMTKAPNGATTIYAQPTGNTQNLMPGIGAATSPQTQSLLLYAAIGVCVVMLLKR